MADALSTLRAMPLFEGLGDDVLHRVLEVGVEHQYPAGEVLARASEEGSDVFVILEGVVTVDDPGNDPMGPGAGEFVGDLALLVPDAVRSAWVRAKTDLSCLVISGDDFQQLLPDEPR